MHRTIAYHPLPDAQPALDQQLLLGQISRVLKVFCMSYDMKYLVGQFRPGSVPSQLLVPPQSSSLAGQYRKLKCP